KLAYGVVPGIIGKEVGIEPGDKVLMVNGKPAVAFNTDVLGADVMMGGAVLTIERQGEQQEINVPTDILNKVADHKAFEFAQPRRKMRSVGEVQKGSEAERMQFQVGDSILAVNGIPTVFFDQFSDEIKKNVDKPINVSVMRDGQELSLAGRVDSTATVGVSLTMEDLPVTAHTYGFLESLPIGTKRAFEVITVNIKGFGKIFKGDVRADKALSGPVGIAKMFGTEVNWLRFWSLVGMLSMALAFMNLLPIPALDGGHVLFLLVEMI